MWEMHIKVQLCLRFFLCRHLGEGLVIINQNLPCLGAHEAVRRRLAAPGIRAHLCARDEKEVVRLCRIKESHLFLGLAVRRNAERQDVEFFEPRSHLEDHLAVVGKIQVLVLRGVLHSGGIAPNDVEVGTGVHTRLGVPLHLRRPSVNHGAWEDGNDRRLGVEDAVLKHRVVLLHTLRERNIIGLRPTAQRMKKKNWILVAHLQKSLSGVGHQ
mmetsp:Transcript_67/g.145  ORF Transcript_67/g.145 Transcript_67/m.145 type:complete len:213 (+) Transcript_67:576-1214(+)